MSKPSDVKIAIRRATRSHSGPPDAISSRRARAGNPATWQTHDRLAMFMRNAITCPVCQMAAEAAGASIAGRLHVVLVGKTLIVTEADDLHQPGRWLCGERVMEGDGTVIFRLLPTPIGGMAPDRHTPAAGIALVSWRDSHRRLKVLGAAAGARATHDCLYDAIELMPGQH